MAVRAHAEKVRQAEDAKIAQVAEILEVIDQAVRYRRLFTEIESLPADMVAEYRRMALQIFGALEAIAQNAIDSDRISRHYDDSLNG